MLQSYCNVSSGLYTSLSGAVANLDQVEVVANNIANASTTGFRRDQLRFDTILGSALPFASAAAGRVDLSPGTSRLTSNPLNAALDGEGFFVIAGPDGQELYTRRGDFRLTPEGVLTLPSGAVVQGGGGPITVPPGARPELRADGTVTANGAPVGKLRVVRFESAEGLTKAGESAIAADPASPPQDVESPRLAVGFVEESNVDLSSELVNLILAQRSFEASMNSLRINDELTQSLIQQSQR